MLTEAVKKKEKADQSEHEFCTYGKMAAHKRDSLCQLPRTILHCECQLDVFPPSKHVLSLAVLQAS